MNTILSFDTSASAQQPVSHEEAKQYHFEMYPLQWLAENGLTPSADNVRLTTYEIFCIRKGSGYIHVNLQSFEVDDLMIYFLRPGQLRCLQLSTDAEGYYISLCSNFFYAAGIDPNFSFLSLRFQQSNLPVSISIDEATQQEMEEIWQRMEKEFRCYLSLRFEIIKSLLKVFLLYLSRQITLAPATDIRINDQNLVNRFILLLSQNFSTKKMVGDYAEDLCVTRSYLNQIVKRVTGSTASQYIQQYVITEAKHKAMASNRTMKEIAYELGFDDIAHFSKFFKSNSGMNFSSFKKEMFRMHY